MRPSIYCFFLFIIAIQKVPAQDQHIVDSLQSLLELKVGADRYSPLYELTFEYINKDNEKALEIIQQAEEAALLSGDSLWIVKSKRVTGQLLYFLQRSREAYVSLSSALPIAMRNDYLSEEFNIEIALGKLDLLRGEYDKALMFYFYALELAGVLEDTHKLARAFHYIGIAYYKLKDNDKALRYYFKSLEVHKYNPAESSFFMANIGLCYANLGDFSNARRYIQRSLDDCGIGCSGVKRMNIEYAFGVVAEAEQNYKAAEKHFLNSYRLAKRIVQYPFSV